MVSTPVSETPTLRQPANPEDNAYYGTTGRCPTCHAYHGTRNCK